MALLPSPSAGCFAHVATKQTDTTSKCTIPFGLPPEPETTRFAETHCITLKRGLDRPNGNRESQGDALSKHELSRIHHELAINIHRPLIAFHRPFIASSQKGAAPGHALFLRQQCTLYILHCTLKKGQNRLASYRRPSGFGICFFLIAETANRIPGSLVASNVVGGFPIHGGC